MRSKILKLLAISTIGLTLSGGLASAGAPEALAARQSNMKIFGKSVGALAAIMKGETPYDAAAVKSVTDAMGSAYAAIDTAGGWAKENQSDSPENYMKPEFYSDTAGATATRNAFEDGLAAVVASTDEAGFKAAFPGLGGSCKGCHEKFRKPKG